MLPEGRVERMLEEILSSGRTPEEVCTDAPELLHEVLERWHHLRSIEAQLRSLFPQTGELPSNRPLQPFRDAPSLAEIPGYDVTEVLGSGGMGIVYKGIHRKLDRAVAIKMLLASRYASTREAAALSRTCSGRLAPTITLEMFGRRRIHATASWARVMPWRSAIGLRF